MGRSLGNNRKKQPKTEKQSFFFLIKLKFTQVSGSKGGGFVGQYKNYYINH